MTRTWIAVVLAVLAVLVLRSTARAQHEGHQMPSQSWEGAPPESRMGSGTAWLPDSSPMRMVHLALGGWRAMFHGAGFLVGNSQMGPRGDDELSLVNWAMIMAHKDVLRGRLALHAMASVEPWTVGGEGYPLLLQSGESYRGVPLVDRQHPHDLFMELAALYEGPLSGPLNLSLYLAPVGEPALGPVAYPHRPSSWTDPLAPLSHHWQDATHITFGVVTAGLFNQYVKVEGSVFNGREPDEQRADFDYRALDSYAGRVTVNPSPSFSAAAWYGYLESPEGLEPEESVNRYGFSLLVTRPLGIRPRHSRWSGAFIWSANKHPGERTEPSLVLESMLELSARHAVGGRVEWVRKSARDLSISGVATGTEHDIGTAVLSGSWRFVQAGAFDLAAGMRFAANFVPRELSGVYGSRTPFGAAIYVRAFPRHSEHAR